MDNYNVGEGTYGHVTRLKKYPHIVRKRYHDPQDRESFSPHLMSFADIINKEVNKDVPKSLRPSDEKLPIFVIGPLDTKILEAIENHQNSNTYYLYVSQDTTGEMCRQFKSAFTFLYNLTCMHKLGLAHTDIHFGNILCHNNYYYLIDLDLAVQITDDNSALQLNIDFIRSLHMFKDAIMGNGYDALRLADEFILKVYLFFIYLNFYKRRNNIIICEFERHILYLILLYRSKSDAKIIDKTTFDHMEKYSVDPSSKIPVINYLFSFFGKEPIWLDDDDNVVRIRYMVSRELSSKRYVQIVKANYKNFDIEMNPTQFWTLLEKFANEQRKNVFVEYNYEVDELFVTITDIRDTGVLKKPGQCD